MLPDIGPLAIRVECFLRNFYWDRELYNIIPARHSGALFSPRLTGVLAAGIQCLCHPDGFWMPDQVRHDGPAAVLFIRTIVSSHNSTTPKVEYWSVTRGWRFGSPCTSASVQTAIKKARAYPPGPFLSVSENPFCFRQEYTWLMGNPCNLLLEGRCWWYEFS